MTALHSTTSSAGALPGPAQTVYERVVIAIGLGDEAGTPAIPPLTTEIPSSSSVAPGLEPAPPTTTVDAGPTTREPRPRSPVPHSGGAAFTGQGGTTPRQSEDQR